MRASNREYPPKNARRFISIVLLVPFLLLSLTSCMAGKQLTTEGVQPSELKGTFTILLYGCRYPDDIENVAILDKEGDPYTFEIYAPGFSYKVKTGLSAEEALSEADRFLRCSFYYEHSRLNRIFDQAGNPIGYELRPLYSPIRFGQYDVLDIHYTIRDSTVIVYIKLDPSVERALEREGGPEDRDGKR